MPAGAYDGRIARSNCSDSFLHRAAALPTLRLAGLALAAALGVSCAVTDTSRPGPEPPRDLVVLVHGMGRTPLSMWPLARALEREGYAVLNFGYSSVDGGVADLGPRLVSAVRERDRAPGGRVHFVAHSLGNVLVRWALANGQLGDIGRVVMLAPPNQGAQAASDAAPWLGWLLDPLPDLQPGSAACALPAPEGVEIGVIAGESDARVSLDETHLPGEAAHVVVPAGHSFIMFRHDVQVLTLHFLREGRFAAN